MTLQGAEFCQRLSADHVGEKALLDFANPMFGRHRSAQLYRGVRELGVEDPCLLKLMWRGRQNVEMQMIVSDVPEEDMGKRASLVFAHHGIETAVRNGEVGADFGHLIANDLFVNAGRNGVA